MNNEGTSINNITTSLAVMLFYLFAIALLVKAKGIIEKIVIGLLMVALAMFGSSTKVRIEK